MALMTRSMLAATVLGLLAAAPVAAAEHAHMVRVRGTIESIDGRTVHVKARNGAALTVKLPDGARVLALDPKSLADVKPGVFVGITAMPQHDGTEKAVEIHIFPEAMRGTGEGHRPWDLFPHSTMTNANIASAVASANGQKLVLKYKGGEKTFIVPADVIVVAFAPAHFADLKPGEKIFIVAAQQQADGTLEARGIVFGRNGLTPPM